MLGLSELYSQERTADMVAIVGFMRFSIVSESHKRGYQATRDKTVEEALGTVLNPERIENRLRLVEIMPLASLSAQTDPDFVLHLLISTELRAPDKARVYALSERRPYLRVTEIGLQDDVQQRMRSLLVAGEPTVTFRLDDDDAVGAHHVADLRALATPDNEGKFLSNPRGLYVQPGRDGLVVQDVTYVHNAFGIGFLSSRGETVFGAGAHNQTAVPVAIGDRPRAWVRSIHAASDSREKFMPGIPAVPLRPELYPEYAFIDFPALRASLSPVEADGLITRMAVSLRSKTRATWRSLR
jgi:hypothetical protein